MSPHTECGKVFLRCLLLKRKRRTLVDAPLLLKMSAEGLGFGVGFAGFAFAALFHLLGEFFALLGAGFGALLGLLVELMLSTKKFDVGHLGCVTLAGSDAGGAAIACRVARGNGGEEAVDRLRRHEVGRGLTTGVDGAALAEGDHLLN